MGSTVKHDILKGHLKAIVTNMKVIFSLLEDAYGSPGGHAPQKGGPKNCRFICRSFPPRVRVLFEFLLYLIRMVFQMPMVDTLVSVLTSAG